MGALAETGGFVDNEHVGSGILPGAPIRAPAVIAALQARLALRELSGQGVEKPDLIHTDLSVPVPELFEL